MQVQGFDQAYFKSKWSGEINFSVTFYVTQHIQNFIIYKCNQFKYELMRLLNIAFLKSGMYFTVTAYPNSHCQCVTHFTQLVLKTMQ